MGHDLAPETLNRIHEVMVAEETPSPLDDLSQPEIQELSDQVSQELFDQSVVHLPMLTPEQEQTILQSIIRVVFQVLTTSESERRSAWISSNLVADTSQALLSCPERRRQLAIKINQMVDIPLLGEEQEEKILVSAVEKCANTLQQLLPPELLRNLQRETPQGLSDMKDYLIQSVNAKVDLLGFTEEQEAAMISAMIDILIDLLPMVRMRPCCSPRRWSNRSKYSKS